MKKTLTAMVLTGAGMVAGWHGNEYITEFTRPTENIVFEQTQKVTEYEDHYVQEMYQRQKIPKPEDTYFANGR